MSENKNITVHVQYSGYFTTYFRKHCNGDREKRKKENAAYKHVISN